MAFLWKDPRSKFWQAGWKDEDGRRRNRSTKIEAKACNRRMAQKVADSYEDVARNAKTVRHLKETVADLAKEITGTELRSATVDGYFTEFIERKRGETGKATLRFYETVKRDFLGWLGERRASMDIDLIRPIDITAFRNEMLKKVSEATVKNKVKALRAVFSAAHREGIVLLDPTANLKLTRKGKTSEGTQRRPFTVDELRLICGQATGEWKSMILFGLYTGQRLGDLATLRWSNLDTERGELRLTTRKGNRSVTIPMAEALVNHIAELEVPDDPTAYVHPELAAHYENKGASTLSNQFSDLLADCGLRDPVSHRSKDKGRDVKRTETTVSFHSLRATAVTLLHEAGIPSATVEEWVGHDSREVHRAYIKLGREALMKASKALPDLTKEDEETE